ncbi:MAG: class I SAM-dependent methyltransferase [Waltera sp.]
MPIGKGEALTPENVTFRQGDVGELPYEDDIFDTVLSLNGFTAFPDKEAAYREVFSGAEARRYPAAAFM